LVAQRPDVSKTTRNYLSDNGNVFQDAQMPFSSRALSKILACHKGLARLAACGLTFVIWVGPTPSEAEPKGYGTLGSCLKAVVHQHGDEILCDYMALLTSEERDDMRRLSRGLLQDASCLVKIRIARALVEPALTAQDHVFQSPPQPVKCDIKTKNGGFPITATFAPEVTFKGGLAVAGTPGLANVEGINSYLAWPVVVYVNRSARIRNAMLEIINTYKPRLRLQR